VTGGREEKPAIPGHPPAPDLLARLRGGDEQAAAEVFGRFAHRLAGLARQKLGKALRGKEDPDDAVQSALKSFFLRYAAGQYELASWDDLWGLLTRITAHKCGHRFERFRAAHRDVRREVSAPDADDSNTSWEFLARDPTPAQALMLAELLEELHRPLGERDRGILALRLQGEEVATICAQMQCSERTVFRVLDRIRWRLERQCEEP
jgi:DNA-directed RNA polymerase specialized sigma24 family protein